MLNHCHQDLYEQAKVNAANFEAMYITKDYVFFNKKPLELDLFRIWPQENEVERLKAENQKMHVDCVTV